MRRRGGQRGFTLIETLVSLSIAALAITGFYSSLSLGLTMERRANDQAEQMLIATQIMDRVGVDIVPRSGVQDSGSLRGLDWSLTISERGTDDMRLGPLQAGELVYVYVTVARAGSTADPLVLRGIRYSETPL
ncbi:type II secretion system protein J [Loktanella agnita]|uniref:PulJ/GspJ family protein n=1 Tax=Loktanella agnita TaxID=287097 RepID=UPI003986E75D